MGFVKVPLTDNPNITSYITDSSTNDLSVQKYFVIGVTFIGGMIAGFFIYCFLSLAMRYFRESELDFELSGIRSGIPNLSFVGDDSVPVVDDHPPDYASVVCDRNDTSSASNHQKQQSSWLRFCRRASSTPTEATVSVVGSPPSYDDTIPFGNGTRYNVT